MGTQEVDRDWVDVANELLSKCHLSLRLRKLTNCDAHVFVALYESILGEKVPDYIIDPRCQEDDIHNVQSVIDSLSLDYLQISLSHITGENVVRGHKESIENLLEIFDGLLEYLNEDTSEESLNSEPSPNEEVQSEEKEPEGASVSSGESDAQSSNGSHQPNAEDVVTNDEIQASEPLSPPICRADSPQSNTIPSAVPLRPPSQSHGPHPKTAGLHTTAAEAGADQAPVQLPETVPGSELDSQINSAALSERSSSRQNGNNKNTKTLEVTNGGPQKVLFHTQPDVLFLTLQNETRSTDSSPSDTEEDLDAVYHRKMHNRRTSHRDRARRGEEDAEPLSSRRQRNKKNEEELHKISENLSHRLEELDMMLKRVLCEPGQSREDHHSPDAPKEQGRMSHQRSDSEPECSHPGRSASPRQPPQRTTVEDAFFVDDGRQSNVVPSDPSQRGKPAHKLSQRKLCRYLLNKMYQEELEKCEDKQTARLDRERRRALEAEREYRETILKDASKTHKFTPDKRKPQQRSAPASGRRPRDTPRKEPDLKVKDNDLLPVLAEELPHLHVSSRVLRQMWEEQMQQVDRLHAMSSPRKQRCNKVSQQLEEAHRKHNLLVGIHRKDQEHSRRLRDFKERIQQQKSTQSQLREQRQQIARAKKYHSDFHVQHRARLMKARTKEERMFRQLFEDGLSVQKDRLLEQRAFAREQQQEQQRRQENFIKSMENYYKDQFSLMAEKLAQERQDIQVRKKAQEKALLKMKRELRSRMEREIKELQKIIVENDEDEHFQDLDVQRLRNRIHLASFNYSTSYLQ
ncbi:unnamed protein product [Knipowitschia caucasica]